MNCLTLTTSDRTLTNPVKVAQALRDGQEFIISDISCRWDGKPCTLPEIRKYEPDRTHLEIYLDGSMVAFFEISHL